MGRPDLMKALIFTRGEAAPGFFYPSMSTIQQFTKPVDEESLYHKMTKHSLSLPTPKQIYIVTNEDHNCIILDLFIEIEFEIECDCNQFVEPEGKNTLFAIYNGVKAMVKENNASSVAFLSSNNLIEADGWYIEAFWKAEHLSSDHHVVFDVVFGVRPTPLCTSYDVPLQLQPLPRGECVPCLRRILDTLKPAEQAYTQALKLSIDYTGLWRRPDEWRLLRSRLGRLSRNPAPYRVFLSRTVESNTNPGEQSRGSWGRYLPRAGRWI